MGELSFAVPEKEGVKSRWIINLIEKLSKLEYVHHFSVIRNSKVLAYGSYTPYSKEDQHHLFSGTKSLTALALGLIYDRKIISLEDKVLFFFPEVKVEGEYWDKMTIRHLLTMSTGHDRCPLFSRHNNVSDIDLIDIFFSTPLKYEPGTVFTYNTCATYIISEIITRASGKCMDEWLEKEVFNPMGMSKVDYLRVKNGSPVGGVGGFIRRDDWAKFGLLMLNYGAWDGIYRHIGNRKYTRYGNGGRYYDSH